MKALSIKLDDKVLDDTEKLAVKLELTRNHYIQDAIVFYNQFNRRNLMKAQLAKEAVIAKPSSMEVLKEFEALND
ncbi:MAG: hypothetical protein ACKO7B_11505 [Flavobacteriales bacterium]